VHSRHTVSVAWQWLCRHGLLSDVTRLQRSRSLVCFAYTFMTQCRVCMQADAAAHTHQFARYTLQASPGAVDMTKVAEAQRPACVALATLLNQQRGIQLARFKKRQGAGVFLVPSPQGQGRWVQGVRVAESCTPWLEAFVAKVTKLDTTDGIQIACIVHDMCEVRF
jgi:hypothetical protein